MQRPRRRFLSPKNPQPLEYFELLRKIDANLIHGREVAGLNLRKSPARYFWIRHDVDHDIDKALNMAYAEDEMGYKSTYFMLHTAKYWESEKFLGACQTICELEHDIGIHNNAVAEFLRCKKRLSPLEIISAAVDRLSQVAKIEMTSSHGDKMCREMGFNNYEMWFECPWAYRTSSIPTKSDQESGRFNWTWCAGISTSLTLSGLQEAYFTRRDAYLSDSGHVWRGYVDQTGIPPFEAVEPYLDPIETIERFNRMDSGVLQVLVHPCWWQEE